MDERLNDLVRYLREARTPETTVDEVEAFLSSQGYDRRQIGVILSLVFADSTRPGDGIPLIPHSMTFRVMGPHERGRFSAEAWGHLLALTGSGALSPSELEQVIERALFHVDGRIALDDLRAILDGSGLDDGAPPDHVTVH